jgi:hypothetical protein
MDQEPEYHAGRKYKGRKAAAPHWQFRFLPMGMQSHYRWYLPAWTLPRSLALRIIPGILCPPYIMAIY